MNLDRDMCDDDQKEEKERTNPVPEDFMPFGCTELNEALIDYARTHLNETEETRRRGLKDIREFIKRDLKALIELEDILLLCYLRCRRFDIGKTCSLMKNSADFVYTYRRFFNRIDTEIVRRTLESKVVGFLPYRDSKGRALVLVRSECWNPDELKMEDIIFSCIISLHITGENPVNQVAGYVVIMDYKNLSFRQVIAASSWMRVGIQAVQRCSAFLVKEIYVVHSPALFKACWNIVQPFVGEEIKKRITFCKSPEWESLHRKIPPCILPEELGGQLGPYSYEHWTSDVPTMRRKFFDRCHRILYTQETN